MEVSDHVPHRTTYRQNNSWVVREIPVDWLPVHFKTKRLASLFRRAQAATLPEFHIPPTKCFVRRWFCVVHGLKPPLHHHNLLSFGKFQDTERFLIPCPCHVSSQLPPSGEICKYTMVSRTQKKFFERFSIYWYSPLRHDHPGSCSVEVRNPRGAYELPCIIFKL
jgi:hypothetical protein